MNRTPEERRELLRAFIRERQEVGGEKFNVQRWAKLSGVSKNTLYNFLNGHSDSLDHQTYAKLARTMEVPVWRLSGESPEPTTPTAIWVTGYIEAGAFNSAVEWDQSKWYPVDVPVPDRFRRLAKALEVRGQSMNLEYKEGSIVIWVDMLDFRPARNEDHVIVYSFSKDDQVEATVKELRQVNGKQWLWPKSDDPAHQLPIDTDNPPEGVKRIEVKGIVIGDYRRRVQ